MSTNLAEFADIANPLALQGAEVGGDTTLLQVHNTRKRLVQKRSNRGHGKTARFGLAPVNTVKF